MATEKKLSHINICRKWVGIVWLFIEVNITSANIFGFPALFEIFPKYEIYSDECHSIVKLNATEKDCSDRTQQYQNALTLGIIFFNIPSIFIGIIIDNCGGRFMKLIGVLFHIIGWLALALLKPGRDWLLFIHTLFVALSGIIVQLTSYASCNYFSKARPFLFALLAGSSAAASIWYSVFQSIIDKNWLTLSQLSYIWLSFGVLLFLSSFLFLDWKFKILNLPYKFVQDSDETAPTSTTNETTDNPSVETKWYTNIRQRTGIWKHITSPLYILAVLFLSILMIANILLSVTWYPWVFAITNENRSQADDYTFALNMSSLSQIVLCPIIGLLLSIRGNQGRRQKLLMISIFQICAWMFNIATCIVCMFVKMGVIIPALVLYNFGRSSTIAGTQSVVATFFPCQYIGTLIGLMWTIAGAITCIQYALVKLTVDVNDSWKAWVIVLALIVLMSCHWIHLLIMYFKEARMSKEQTSRTTQNPDV